jgi:type II pantothenate kinase
MIIGIDIGGTTTKLVGYAEHEMLRPVSVKADDPIASAAGALGKFLTEEEVGLQHVHHLAVTGVGAGRLGDALLGLPVHHVEEFEAIGRGGVFLGHISPAIVVSMGTGTAIVVVDGDGIRHWGGTGIGGGTLVGLSKRLFGVTDVRLVSHKAHHGNLARVDLSVGDIASLDIPGLPPTVTASNFGKCADDATEADVALALLNLVFQTIGVVARGAAIATKQTAIIATGRLSTVPQAENIFAELSERFGVTFHIPPHAAYATAIGAALATSADE